MRRLSKPKNRMKEMSLHIMAEKALREAVAEAIAEHKLRGHPIIIWQDGKVVSIPPEEIIVPMEKRNRPPKDSVLYVKEKNRPYGKIKK
jgi:hypothetical protein